MCKQCTAHKHVRGVLHRSDAERGRDLFWRNLVVAQQSLEQEAQARQANEAKLAVMSSNWERMEAALQLERLIK